LTPDEIRELQGKLKAAGFNPGAIDGFVGRQTRSAMRDYAQARSLPNADATRDLLVRLNAEPPAAVASAPASPPPAPPPPVAQQVDKPTPDGATALTPDDVMRTVYIRQEPHTVLQALNRQIAHYAYHVGQIVFLAKHFRSAEWTSLSVPRGKSEEVNRAMAEKRKAESAAPTGTPSKP